MTRTVSHNVGRTRFFNDCTFKAWYNFRVLFSKVTLSVPKKINKYHYYDPPVKICIPDEEKLNGCGFFLCYLLIEHFTNKTSSLWRWIRLHIFLLYIYKEQTSYLVWRKQLLFPLSDKLAETPEAGEGWNKQPPHWCPPDEDWRCCCLSPSGPWAPSRLPRGRNCLQPGVKGKNEKHLNIQKK